MKSKWAVAVVCVLAVTAVSCKKKDDENVSSDSTAVQGMDTVNMPTAVPTTDTVVKTTTTEVDTVHSKVDKDTLKSRTHM